MSERGHNYDIARDRAEQAFLRYDQEAMVRKFGLPHDQDSIRIRFLSRDYRVDRRTGRVERLPEMVHAGFNEAMTIFDVLCESRPDCRLSGEFVRVNDLDGVVKTAHLGGNLFDGSAKAFTHRTGALCAACEALGGLPGRVGDVSYTIPLFDFLPVVLQFWDADDEFDAVLKIMWDRRTLDFMRYETTWYAAGHLLERLAELMKETD
ncbi:MAG: DUF3786 domain-containing protein [Oscillospiraceae bacterium]|nr:DUF3786 domain-containing protein [Oscillospiraceae bacterium]